MVLEDERQFHPPDVAPLYPAVLDSCSPLTSPLKNQPPKFRRKYQRHSNNGCIVQYGVSANQLPGVVPNCGYQYDTQVIVKVSNHQDDKHLANKNHSRHKRKKGLIPSTPPKMFIGKLTKNHRSWKESSNKKHITDYYDKKPIQTLGNMFQENDRQVETNEEETSNKSDSASGNDGSLINTVAEVHKHDSKNKKSDKQTFNNVEIMNDKNNRYQEEKSDQQKTDISKFRKQTLKLTKMFTPKTKEFQEDETVSKDVEKAEEREIKKTKQTEISEKDSEFSRIEEICEASSTNKYSKKCYQNPRHTNSKPLKDDETNQNENKSIGIQATPFPPFRLHFLPKSDWKKTDNKLHKVLKLILSQCGLASIVLTWAMLGALVFRLTEGPQEQYQTLPVDSDNKLRAYEPVVIGLKTMFHIYGKTHKRFQVQEMAKQQASLVIGLATDLRQVLPQEPIWRYTIERYADHHEALILSAVSSGYPQRGTIWTYPGSLLFATSLLTTLGFGAPVPRTVIGRMSAIIFAGLGIPMHLLLVLNIGLLLAVKLTKLANICSYKVKFLKFKLQKAKQRGSSQENSTPDWPEELFALEQSAPPQWLKFFPLVAIPTYYFTGFLLFGVARGKDFPEVFLFPLDFTAAGGVASTYGPLRILYAMYLEGAVLLASTNVALLRVSATRGFTTVGIKLGLMTNSFH